MDLILTLSGNVIISFPLFVSAGSRHLSEERRKVGRNTMKRKSKQKQIRVINSSKSLICLAIVSRDSSSQNENYVIMYSPSFRFKPVWLAVFSSLDNKRRNVDIHFIMNGDWCSQTPKRMDIHNTNMTDVALIWLVSYYTSCNMFVWITGQRLSHCSLKVSCLLIVTGLSHWSL